MSAWPRQAVNQQMVQAYWHISRLIVEQEQQGQARAEYGKRQLSQLSELLVAAGAGGAEPGQKIYSERVMQTTISAFRFD